MQSLTCLLESELWCHNLSKTLKMKYYRTLNQPERLWKQLFLSLHFLWWALSVHSYEDEVCLYDANDSAAHYFLGSLPQLLHFHSLWRSPHASRHQPEDYNYQKQCITFPFQVFTRKLNNKCFWKEVLP